MSAPKDPVKLLNKCLDLLSRDLNAMASGDTEKKLQPSDQLSLARYINCLDAAIRSNQKTSDSENKKLTEMTDEELSAIAAEVLNKKQ